MNKLAKKIILYTSFVLIIIIVNSIFKELSHNIDTPRNLIWGAVTISNIRNYGMTFGIFENNKILIRLIEFIMLSITLYLYIKVIINSNSTYYIVPIIFILSGGAGNVFERFINGFVTDYIRLNIPYFTYFNLDDVFVIIGIALFIYQSIRNNKMIGKIYSL